MQKLNIVIPIAGPDKDPANTGYIRSLQEIQRKTIIQYAFESLQTCLLYTSDAADEVRRG